MIERQADERPCLALMGEFSAGKSTLANLLIGASPLPVQVVATQLPPVCISYGDDAPYAVDLDGMQHSINLDQLGRSSMEEIAYLQIFHKEDILLQCDLLDMPGISDPNMASEVWERMVDCADGVLWCSHATQAWRQSEAAVWDELPETLRPYSLLLLTRADKLRSRDEVDRVMARVRRETEGLFADVLPISLLTATQEQSDYEAWSASGAEAFASRLIELLDDLNLAIAAETGRPRAGETERLRLPGLEAPEAAISAAREAHLVSEDAPSTSGRASRVLPRRINRTGAGTPRPEAS